MTDKTHTSRDFWSKRLMSLLGIVPLGVYVVLHLWTNLSSLGGAESYNAALLASRRHPAFLVLEVLLGLAILVHTVLGLRLLLRWRPNNLEERTFGNLKFMLQRVAGLGVGAFIVAHVIKARILPAMSPAGVETWHGMREALSEPVTMTVYVLGLLGVSYHLANGLWTALITWGLTVTPQAQRRSQALAFVALIVLLGMSGLSLYGFLQPMDGASAALAVPGRAP
jgi:succinate dehydrogenase / fumarate reductase, cytochrome b subunit